MLELHEGEKVHKVLRRHWYVFLTKTVGIALISLLPVVLLVVALFRSEVLSAEIIGIFLLLSGLLWGIMTVIYFTTWTNYYLDAWIITNLRIIDIEQHGLFMREVSEYALEKVEDVTVKAFGVLANSLNFGDLDVQTAGEESSHFVIRDCTSPDEAKKLIFALANHINTASSYPANKNADNDQSSDVSSENLTKHN